MMDPTYEQWRLRGQMNERLCWLFLVGVFIGAETLLLCYAPLALLVTTGLAFGVHGLCALALMRQIRTIYKRIQTLDKEVP